MRQNQNAITKPCLCVSESPVSYCFLSRASKGWSGWCRRVCRSPSLPPSVSSLGTPEGTEGTGGDQPSTEHAMSRCLQAAPSPQPAGWRRTHRWRQFEIQCQHLDPPGPNLTPQQIMVWRRCTPCATRTNQLLVVAPPPVLRGRMLGPKSGGPDALLAHFKPSCGSLW